MEISILERLDKTVEKYSDKVIFKDKNDKLSYNSFNNITKSIGTYLANIVPSGTAVAVISGRHVYTPAVFLGIVRAGCFYAPMDGDMPVTRLNQILNVLKPKYLITDKEHFSKAKSLSFEGDLILLDNIIDTQADSQLLSIRYQSLTVTSPLYVIFTSGSTGKPKGVITSHLSVMVYIDAVSKVLQIDENDILGSQSPLDYIAAIRDIYLPICFGSTTYIIPKNEFASPAVLFETLNRERITALCWSVSGVELPAKLGGFDIAKPEHLKKLCFSGSVINNRYLKIWQENLPNVLFVNQYGPTEATASCTYYIIDQTINENTVLPIGKPYDNYKVQLLNEDNSPVSLGAVGEICVSGPILALGYYGNKELTDKSFIQNPLNTNYRELIYKTGDLGHFDENGILYFHGRLDRQIKHLGHRIELGEIEEFANSIPQIEDCCSLYYKEKESLYLFYVGNVTAKEIVLSFRKNMPAFMVPRKLIQLKQLPKLPNGKIDMQNLKTYFK